MNISVIIPNYNGEKILKENLPKVIDALVEYKKGTTEIIIPDDASKDNSIAFLKKFAQHIPQSIHFTFLESNHTTNQGFSANINRGVAYAKGDILILLNSDVAPHKNFLSSLIPHFQDENVFAVGCMDESIEDGKKILRGRGLGTWSRGFLMHKRGEINKNNTLWVSGGSGAFRKNIWDAIGGLQNLYNPFYWEDIDLSYRAQKAGYTVHFEPKSIVTHEHTKGAIKTNYQPFRIKKIAYRNQFFFVWLNITDPNLILSHLCWLPYHILSAFLRKDGAFFIGFLLACLQLPKIIQRRHFLKKLLKQSDRTILERYTE